MRRKRTQRKLTEAVKESDNVWCNGTAARSIEDEEETREAGNLYNDK